MIISISGKIGSGKDTVAKMLQYLSIKSDMPTKTFFNHGEHVQQLPAKDIANWNFPESTFVVKRFADKIKDTVCLWIGCTREQLEDREFKEKPLGEQWHVWKVHNQNDTYIFRSEAERDDYMSELKEKLYDVWEDTAISDKILTPRKLMQLLGTEAGRNIIHPDIWVNALFADYKPSIDKTGKALPTDSYKGVSLNYKKSDWIIPDMRFLNELDGVRKRNGITIRIERQTELRLPNLYKQFQEDTVAQEWGSFLRDIGEYKKVYHQSETSLDHVDDWDYIIHNDGSMEALLNSVKQIHKYL